MKKQSKLFTRGELAKRWGVNPSTVWRGVQKRTIEPPVETPFGNRWTEEQVERMEKSWPQIKTADEIVEGAAA